MAWNRKVSHILATGGSGGFVTVWDLKTKKASLTLNNNRRRVSAIAWDPHNSTKLLTATPDDNAPIILLWDLRNSNAPERTLQGHEQGVLSLSWCEQDADLLLSCGKDNRTLVWNPQTGERYGEFPEVTNWTFLTRFNPHNPSLSATASFDGKIAIQTLQNTNPSTAQTAAQNSLDGEDFFTSAQTQPQGASFSLPKAPAWLRRPIGASFGFGGKVIVFKKNSTAAGHPGTSKIVISQFSVDSDVTTEAEKFESSLQNGDLKAICASHLEQAKTEEEKADWLVMETLVAADPRQQVIDYLGFNKEEEDTANGDEKETSEESELLAPKENGVEKSKHRRMVSMFDGEQGDDFLTGLAANKGAKTEDPFHLLSEGNIALEDQVTKALMLGNFAKAAEICLKDDRIADAFIIANCGGKELVDKVQAAYLSKKKGSPSYLRLLSSVIGENLWDVVYNADLANWKETMATLCTFAKPDEFPDLCEALGDRILEQGSRKDASFCYLVGSKLEKAVTIWIEELEEAEQAGMKEQSEDSTFSVHAKSLQKFIEKVTVFRHVTKFNDKEVTLTSDWKLGALYDKYTEYADIVAAHGLLTVAQKYLDLLPSSYPAAEVARNRVKLATHKAPTQTAARTATSASRPVTRQQPIGYQAPQTQPAPLNPYGPPVPAHTPAGNTYAPPGVSPAANMYTPPASTTAPNPYAPPTNPYAPPGAIPYQPSTAYAAPQPAGFAPYGQPAMGPPPMGGPPRGSTPSSNPPLLRAKDVGDWNDVPTVVKAPGRKSTPRAVVSSPFPGQQPAGVAPPPQSPYGAPPRGTATPPPPPPKSSGPPRVTSPLAGPQATQMPMRPPSTASNVYAPPPPMAGAVPPPSVPRTASPYNAPPAGLPPSNRYAPAPAAQQANQPPAPGASMPPPPTASRPPPANPYAPSMQAPAAPGPYGTPGPYSAASTPVSQPPLAPPPSAGPPPMGGPPRAAQGIATPPPPRAAATPPRPRHPAGDRSHIPANAQPMVDILNRDMQRVASKAPANFAPQVKDTQKRLNLLFDHLNNDELVQPATIDQLIQLAEALETRNYDLASQIQVDIQKNKTEECGNWMVSFPVL